MQRTSDESLSPIARALAFLRRGQWQVQTDKLPWLLRTGVQALRFCSLVFDGFRRNQCSLRAASLTFYSLMSLVPVLVFCCAVAAATLC